MRRSLTILMGLALGLAAEATPVQYTVEIAAGYPHDPGAYTQGLIWHDGHLLESTGRYGESTLRRITLENGEVEDSVSLDRDRFGEGLARVGDRLIQLTWKAGRGLIYNADTLERVGRFDYAGEGWGLTYDGEHLIMSDGSDELQRLDPDSFELKSRLPVHVDGQPIRRLNELEMVDGQIWANVYGTDLIARIDPASGAVVGTINAAPLREQLPAGYQVDVFNGIAHDPATDRLFVTGKYWPRLFEIRVVPSAGASDK